MPSEMLTRWTCDLCGDAVSTPLTAILSGHLQNLPEKWVLISVQEGDVKKLICPECVKRIRKAAPAFCPRCVKVLRVEAASAQAKADPEDEEDLYCEAELRPTP